ncbi:unnamed protein product [Spirodela intermedia]|uniref:Uncharacterized protein n=2 Tax=Spirodela intermedia TaxID=51605 RepID=A0A7I8JKM4_SPIIN|nr:unnamed protein product [Spirodela intermedia]CAA6670600.1 unnamed protein product [Spirodela intermedia]CAA7407676.1 unnamed protein product [Spirodela intermedia]
MKWNDSTKWSGRKLILEIYLNHEIDIHMIGVRIIQCHLELLRTVNTGERLNKIWLNPLKHPSKDS